MIDNKIECTQGIPLRHPEVKDTNPKDAIGATKPSLAAVPCPVLFEEGAVMTAGGAKYRRHNYRIAGVRASVYYDACLRHVMAWWEGEDLDPETGLHHLAHARACLGILRDAALNGNLRDDRPPSAYSGWRDQADVEFSYMLSKFPNPKPPYTKADVS